MGRERLYLGRERFVLPDQRKPPHFVALAQRLDVTYPYLTPGENKDGELHRRYKVMKQIRESTYLACKEAFGERDDRTLSAAIAGTISPFLDEIFIAQMAEKGKPGPPRKWTDYTIQRKEEEEEVVYPARKLQDAIAALKGDATLAPFFRENPYTSESLDILSGVADSSDPGFLEEGSLELLDLAVAQQNAGKPILFITLCDYYLNGDGPIDGRLSEAEPSLRLLFPKKIDDIQRRRSTFQRANHLRGRLKRRVSKTSEIIADTVMIGGSELNSVTTAEAFGRAYNKLRHKGGYVVSENIIEAKLNPFIEQIVQAFPTIDRGELVHAVVLLYAFHELAHNVYTSTTPLFEELSADAPSVSALFAYYRKNPAIATAALLAETLFELSTSSFEGAYGDGYYASYHYLLSQLIKRHILYKKADGSWALDGEEQNERKFLRQIRKTHRRIVREFPSVRKLNDIILSQEQIATNREFLFVVSKKRGVLV